MVYLKKICYNATVVAKSDLFSVLISKLNTYSVYYEIFKANRKFVAGRILLLDSQASTDHPRDINGLSGRPSIVFKELFIVASLSKL